MTNAERETIIVFNEAGGTADVETYSSRLIKIILKVAEERDEVTNLVYDEEERHLRCTLPKKWVKIRPGRILTEEQRQAYSDRAKKMMEARYSHFEEEDEDE